MNALQVFVGEIFFHSCIWGQILRIKIWKIESILQAHWNPSGVATRDMTNTHIYFTTLIVSQQILLSVFLFKEHTLTHTTEEIM